MKQTFILNKLELDKFYETQESINKRVEYIYETLIEIYKIDRKKCDYKYGEREFLNFNDGIPLIINGSGPMICVLNPYGYFDFQFGFPFHWLWESFEQEVKDGILTYERLVKDPNPNLLDVLGKR